MTDQPFTPTPTTFGTEVPHGVPSAPPVPQVKNSESHHAGSTTEVAKSQAADVAGGAKDAAQQVAGTAKEQAGQVAQEAKTQVKQVVGQARSELSDQAQVQQTKAAGGLRSLGEQLTAMAKGSDQPGVATDVAHQAADRVHQLAGWLEDRDPQGVLDDVRAFARRKPGVFLVAALGAGVLAGRLGRGLSASSDASSDASAPAVAPGRADSPAQLGAMVTPAVAPSSPGELADRLGASDFSDTSLRGRGNLPGVDG